MFNAEERSTAFTGHEFAEEEVELSLVAILGSGGIAAVLAGCAWPRYHLRNPGIYTALSGITQTTGHYTSLTITKVPGRPVLETILMHTI